MIILTLYYLVFKIFSSGGSTEINEFNENSVANITISNETLNKSGESIVVSGKGMSSTVKVKLFFFQLN